jgi:hypothetical protein
VLSTGSFSWCQTPIWGHWSDFCYCQTVTDLFMWGTHSDETTGLSFITSAGPRQRSHSSVCLLRDSLPNCTVSGSKLPQPGCHAPYLYPQGEMWPSYASRHWSLCSPPTTTRSLLWNCGQIFVSVFTVTIVSICCAHSEKRTGILFVKVTVSSRKSVISMQKIQHLHFTCCHMI